MHCFTLSNSMIRWLESQKTRVSHYPIFWWVQIHSQPYKYASIKVWMVPWVFSSKIKAFLSRSLSNLRFFSFQRFLSHAHFLSPTHIYSLSYVFSLTCDIFSVSLSIFPSLLSNSINLMHFLLHHLNPENRRPIKLTKSQNTLPTTNRCNKNIQESSKFNIIKSIKLISKRRLSFYRTKSLN